MIKKITTSKEKEIANFYNNIYEHGGYYSDEMFNSEMLKILKLDKNKTKKLLDIACGQGTFLAMTENLVKTYGVDISKKAIEKAKKTAKNTEFKVGPADKLPFESRFFDYITCLGSLEHFPDIEKSLQEMKRVLKVNGKVLIHVPNSKYLVHKILRIDTQGQINERLATETEWRKTIEPYLKVEKCYKYNTKLYLKWVPKYFCCHFSFLCRI